MEGEEKKGMNSVERKNLVVFGYGLAVICAVVAGRQFFKTGTEMPFFVWLGIGVFFALITAFAPLRLRGFYRVWMRVARVAGIIVSTIVLAVIFYLMFGVAGIILRLLRKDILDERWDKGRASYWVPRGEKSFNPEDCKRQF